MLNMKFYHKFASCLSLLLASSSAATSQKNTNSCCDLLLASSLKPSVLSPSTTEYVSVQKSYWSLQESSLHPGCIFQPRTAVDVAQAVSILTQDELTRSACQFAVKGRTHAPAAGFANINDGVTIDLALLDSMSLSTDGGIVAIGAGASWLQVYDYLNGTGLAVAGGRNGQVGVGGLLTGGGISHFTTRVGWACDNVRNFEVVMASGEVINVNASSNYELFWALKGGANNFGIVTRFDIETFPQEKILVTSLVNDITQRKAMFDAFSEITNATTFDENASLVMGFTFNATSKAWSIGTSAVNTAPDTPSITFEELEAVPNISMKASRQWLADYANETATPPLNWLFWTGTYSVSASLMLEMFDVLNETLYHFNVPGGVFWSIAFEPLPTIIIEKSQIRSENTLGLNATEGNAFIMLLSGLWPNSTSNSAVTDVARQVGKQINDLAQSQGMLRSFQYINYADTSQDPITSYGATNVARLKAISQRYDPSQVFQKQVPGGFKLPR